MSRTFTNQATLESLEQIDGRGTWGKLEVEEQLLRFGFVGSASAAGQTVSIAGSIGAGFYAGRTADGSTYITPSIYNGSSSHVGSGNASRRLVTSDPCSLRGSFDASGNYYSAQWALTDPVPRVYQGQLSGGTYSQVPWGPLMPAIDCIDTPTFVRRVDAVCYTTLGVIIMVGEYNFLNSIATLSFWLVQPGGYRKLATSHQVPLTETYQFWYTAFKAGSFAQAISDGRSITIVFHDGRTAWQFRLSGGVESELVQAMPIDDELYSTSLPAPTYRPTGLVKIGNLYYLSGNMTRPFSNGTQEYMEVYQTSEDAWNWSIGEYSSFVTKTAMNGALVSDGTYVYHAGSGYSYRALLRPMDTGGAKTDLTDYTLEAQVAAAESSADAAQVALLHYADLTSVKPGAVISVSAGYASGDNQYGGLLGTFAFDQKPMPITRNGRGAIQAQAIDLASWKLKQWGSITDVDRWSRTAIGSSLDTLGGFIAKTAQRDVQASGDGFSSVALNDPFVAYHATRDGRDGLMSAWVRFTNVDSYSLTTFGFVFGGDTQGHFNAVMIPKPNTWSGHTQTRVKVMTSNLAPSDTPEGGFQTDSHKVGLWESVLSDTYARMMKSPNATADGSYYYYPTAASGFAANVDYEFFSRLTGDRVQIYAQTRKPTYNQMAMFSQVQLIAEYRFNGYARKSFTNRSYAGFLAGTDVFVKTDAFESAAYGDMDVSLTSASNYGTWNTRVGYMRMNGNGNWTKVVRSVIETPPAIADLNVGRVMRLYIAGKNDNYHTITGIVGGEYTISPGLKSDANPLIDPNDPIEVYFPNSQDTWGEARSGYETTTGTLQTGGAVSVVNDSGIHKLPVQAKMRSFFVNDGGDSTAGSVRYIRTDGSKHVLTSGSEDGTGLGWDTTNPINSAQIWSMKGNHGAFFDGSATQYGLPASGYFMVDDEVVRYQSDTFDQMGNYAGHELTTTWCIIPVYYSLLHKSAGSTSSIRNWVFPGGTQKPGDDFKNIVNPKGLLVEIRGRSNSGNILPDDNSAYRVASVVPVTSPSYNSSSQIVLDHAYPNDITEPVQNTTVAADFAIVSGRGQLGTTKALHASSAPVVYYPKTLTNPASLLPLTDLVRVTRFERYAGLYNSLEDDLAYTCALAGARGTAFRSRAVYSGTLGTGQVSLRDADDADLVVADFVLDLDAHLYASSANGLTGEGRLRIGFRDSYFLDIQQWQDATLNATGRHGNIRLLLQAPASNIQTGGLEAKWLAIVTVPVSDEDLAGSWSGTHAENTAKKLRIRVAVKKNLVSVEIEGQHIWTFDLNAYDYTTSTGTTASNHFQTAAKVTIRYFGGNPSLSVTARVMELNAEVENHVIDMGANGTEALGFVTEDRHIVTRTTQAGGLEFSTFLKRDLGATVNENVYEDEPVDSSLEQLGHVSVSGGEFGEYIDEAWMQQQGYRFGMSQNRLVDTVPEAIEEAKLQQRLSKEYALQHTLTGGGFLVPQPGDRINVRYGTAGSDLPVLAAHDFVLTQSLITLTPKSISGQYDLREYYPL